MDMLLNCISLSIYLFHSSSYYGLYVIDHVTRRLLNISVNYRDILLDDFSKSESSCLYNMKEEFHEFPSVPSLCRVYEVIFLTYHRIYDPNRRMM